MRLFPLSSQIRVNGQYAEWVKRQAGKAGLGFAALSNGFAACQDPAALQAICDRLGPGTINVFTLRWLHRLPLPFTTRDHDAGYWREVSMRQVEISRTIVFDAPRHARGFFEALVADNLDIGRPHNVEIIFSRRIRRDTRGTFAAEAGAASIGYRSRVRPSYATSMPAAASDSRWGESAASTGLVLLKWV